MRFFRTAAPIAVVAVSLMVQAVQSHAAQAQAPNDKTSLRIYFADVEGGQATLFVPPTGENLLIDSGNPGHDARDATRIAKICKEAGIAKIDTVLITHYHNDHVGGLPELAAIVPIGRLYDHGEKSNHEPPEDVASTNSAYASYQKLLSTGKYPRQVVKPGDVLPLQGMHVEIVTTDGKAIAKPLAGGGAGGQNAACASTPIKPLDDSENDFSNGVIITFGNLRIADLGDLTWARERTLMCPIDKLGHVDIYIASHHGVDKSGSAALVNALAPRVAIMDNGGHKGAQPGAWDIIQHSPRITALWQLHTAEAPDAHNVPAAQIANLPGPDAGHSLQLTARKDGSFAVTNHRTGQTVQYGAK